MVSYFAFASYSLQCLAISSRAFSRVYPYFTWSMVTNLSNFTSALSTLSRSYSAIRLHQPVAWARISFQFSSNMALVMFMGSSAGNTFQVWDILGVIMISFPNDCLVSPHPQNKISNSNSLYYVLRILLGFSPTLPSYR